MSIALLLRKARQRNRVELTPVVMRLIGGFWYGDDDPSAVADGWWIDNPDYPATSSDPYKIDTTATEGYQAFVRRGRLYIDAGELVEVTPPSARYPATDLYPAVDLYPTAA